MPIEVGGFTPFTMIDYPDHVAAVIFTQGCAWNCPFCHNDELRPFAKGTISWDDVMGTLEKRIGKLNGVVFSGGDPIMQKNLAAAIQQVKTLGYDIGIHTGGANVHRMKEILPLVDWVGFDMKHRFSLYDKVTGLAASAKPAEESMDLLIHSGVDYEIRTTVDPRILDKQDILDMAKTLHGKGVRTYVLQQYEKNPNNPMPGEPGDLEIAELFRDVELLDTLDSLFDRFAIRAKTSPWQSRRKAAA